MMGTTNGGKVMGRAAEVLVVDDDDVLRHEISDYLAAHGFTVHQASDARETRAHLDNLPIDVVVLDVMLPGEDGLSICRSLASRRGGPSIMMLSAMGDSVDRVLGLELGADDYVVKPVTPRELLARVRALLRRRSGGDASSAPTKAYVFAGFRLDLVRRHLLGPDGSVIMLTPGELSLLGAFVENARRILSREELLHLSRGDASGQMDRALDIQISRLRKKLNEQSDAEIIRTQRGLGYMLDSLVVRQ